MNARVAILFGVLALPAMARAQAVPVDQVPRLPPIDAHTAAQFFDKDWLVSRLQAKFANVKSYAFAYHLYEVGNPSYYAVWWKEMGDAHYYEYLEPSQRMYDAFTYDGTQTRHFAGGNLLYVGKGEPGISMPKASWQTPLDLYAFLQTDEQFLKLKLLLPGAIVWKDLSRRMKYVGTTPFLGCDCFIVRVQGAWDAVKYEKATYDVFIDTATGTPLGWQDYDERGLMIEELALVDLTPFAGQVDGGPFPFVPHFKVTQYQWDATITGPNGKVIPFWKDTRDKSYDSVTLNSIKPGDLRLNVPDLRVIIDQDTKKVTWVKK